MPSIWLIVEVSASVFILFIVTSLIIYYMFSRNNLKKQLKHFEELHQSLKVGKKVLCAQGIYGTVRRIHPEMVDVELAKGITITVSRFAISEVIAD